MKPPGGWPPNPYDYSAPAKGEHFAGRTAEKAALKRFLAAITDTATAHLLLHGRRGIGKTSLLGELERQATARGLVVARMSVDASSRTDREFFAEGLRTIANAILREGGLGGPEGDYAVALEQATLGREAKRGVGPLRVIEFDAATRGNPARLPDTLILADLADLVDAAHEIDRVGIILVVDEADQLASEDPTVQRVRNLLILPGVISTVLAGTGALVAAVDAASAPIGRHFRRLELPPLADKAETRELLTKPLIDAGLNPTELLPHSLVAEIHSLTNGRPFEVALLGHVMFEDLSSRDGDHLHLDESVLDNVIAQVRPSPEDEAAILVIRSLDPEVLRLAARYCVDPTPTLRDHALLRIAFDGPDLHRVDAARDDVLHEWKRLTDLRLADTDGLLLAPAFGELSQTYLKYRARRMGALDNGVEGRFSDRLAGRIQEDIVAAVTPLGAVAYLARSHVVMDGGREPDVSRIVSMLQSGQLGDVATEESPLSDLPTQFQVAPNEGPGGYWGIALMPFEVGEDAFSHVLVFESHPDAPDVNRIMKSIASIFQAAEPYGIRTGVFEHVIIDDVAWVLLGSARTAYIVSRLATYLWYRGRRDAAFEMMRMAFDTFEREGALTGDLLESQLRFTNNLAFMEMAAGHMIEAVDRFSRLATQGGLFPTRSLDDRTALLCNLAASCAGAGRHVEAVEWADRCLELRAEADAKAEDVTAGVLAVYLPDPGWPHQPRLVENPDPFQIATATKAGALAAMDNPSAIDVAREVADAVGARWPSDILEAIGRRLKRPDIIAEADVYRHRASEESADSASESDGRE